MRRMLMVLAASAVGLGMVAAVALAATSPTVTTGSASASQSKATLNGKVNPNGSATLYHFEWGLSRPATPGGALSNQGTTHALRAGTKTISVQVGISSLLPATTYYYRLDA